MYCAKKHQPPPQVKGRLLTTRERLELFYQKHNPSKLPSVDDTVIRFAGREERLFTLLAKKSVEWITRVRLNRGYVMVTSDSCQVLSFIENTLLCVEKSGMPRYEIWSFIFCFRFFSGCL